MRSVRLAFILVALPIGCAPRADREALLHERIDGLMARHDKLHLETVGLVLAAEGEALFSGRGGCTTCHRIDDSGDRYTGPNLGLDPDCKSDHAAVTRSDSHACLPLAERARLRRPELAPLHYYVESIVDPDHTIVPGYARGVMKRVDEPPLALDDDDILRLALFLSRLSAQPSSLEPLNFEILEGTRGFSETCREHRDRRVETSRLQAPE